MTDCIQNDYYMIGKYGCYLLCIFKAFDKEFSINDYYVLRSRGYIDSECTVNNPVGIVSYITGGKKVTVKKSDSPDSRADVRIERWYNPKTKFRHFILRQADGSIWDPLGASLTVKEGKVETYRLYYFIK